MSGCKDRSLKVDQSRRIFNDQNGNGFGASRFAFHAMAERKSQKVLFLW